MVSALVWALIPTWGGLFYASSWVVLAVATASRVRAARAIVDAHREELTKGLSDDTLKWVRRVPFVYVWRDAAKEWGTTWRMTGILALFLVPWFAVRALLFRESWELWLIGPLLILLVVGVRVALRLEVQELIKEERWKANAPHHEDAARYLMLRSTLGKWPPVPSPDGIPGTPAPPNLSPPVRPPPGTSPGPPKSVRPPEEDPPKDDKPA